MPSKEIELESDLWFDQPDAVAAARKAAVHARVPPDSLEHFIDKGYLIFTPELDPDVIKAVNLDVDRFWSRGEDIAYACDSVPISLRGADASRQRRPGCRLHDLHGVSEAVRRLYLDPGLHELVERLFGEPAVAIQSLYFEFGSGQALHRDPQVVPVTPPAHLLAIWIALEDIHPDSGPLVVAPGSHRLPYFRFDTGDHRLPANASEDEICRGLAWQEQQLETNEIALEDFLPRAGQALCWHHSLLHGGRAVVDPRRTRRSLVIHYSTRRHYDQRGITVYQTDSRGQPTTGHIFRTTKLIGDGAAVGFAAPYPPR